jgi:molecular chaperone GrpE
MADTKKNNKEASKNSLQEITELLQRTQANFENYRKQVEKHMVEVEKIASRDVILQILPIIDNFELALKNVDSNKNSTDFVQGLELIFSQLIDILKNNNVEEIDADNKDFDPHQHEALMKVKSELPEHNIIEVLQKGFTLNGKVMRHSKVKISAGMN